MSTLDHAVCRVWLFNLPPHAEREKKHHLLQFLAFRYAWNRTQAAWAASKCAIHNVCTQMPPGGFRCDVIENVRAFNFKFRLSKIRACL
jgi:hypothetical protein